MWQVETTQYSETFTLNFGYPSNKDESMELSQFAGTELIAILLRSHLGIFAIFAIISKFCQIVTRYF